MSQRVLSAHGPHSSPAGVLPEGGGQGRAGGDMRQALRAVNGRPGSPISPFHPALSAPISPFHPALSTPSGGGGRGGGPSLKAQGVSRPSICLPPPGSGFSPSPRQPEAISRAQMALRVPLSPTPLLLPMAHQSLMIRRRKLVVRPINISDWIFDIRANPFVRHLIKELKGSTVIAALSLA